MLTAITTFLVGTFSLILSFIILTSISIYNFTIAAIPHVVNLTTTLVNKISTLIA